MSMQSRLPEDDVENVGLAGRACRQSPVNGGELAGAADDRRRVRGLAGVELEDHQLPLRELQRRGALRDTRPFPEDRACAVVAADASAVPCVHRVREDELVTGR